MPNFGVPAYSPKLVEEVFCEVRVRYVTPLLEAEGERLDGEYRRLRSSLDKSPGFPG